MTNSVTISAAKTDKFRQIKASVSTFQFLAIDPDPMASSPIPGLRSSVSRVIATGFALCLIGNAYALELGANESRKDLSSAIEVLEDPNRALTIEDVRSPSISQQFRRWEVSEDLNIGFSQSAWWFRVPLSVAPNAPDTWLLEVPYTYNRIFDFYAPGKPPVLTGSERPIGSRPILHPHYLFPIKPAQTTEHFYFRVESNYAISLPLSAWQPIAFYRASSEALFIQTLYYGGVLALMLYNLALSISLKDKRFLLYVAFSFFVFLGIFSGNGLGRLVLWPEWNRFDEVAGTFFLMAGTMFSILFSLQFLQTRRNAPRIAFVLYGLAVVCALVSLMQLIGIWIPSLVSIAFQSAGIIGPTLFLALGSASYYALRDRIPGIALFIVAWAVFWVGGLIASLRLFEIVPTNVLTSYALQISTGIEMLLFAFALAEMVKIERRERISAQNELLQAKQSLLDNMRAQEVVLEKTIEERTRELNAALRKEKDILNQYVRFGSLVSHEFRNPLGVINSQATLLKKEQRLDEKGAERVSAIKTAVRRLVKLFDRWFEGDRLETLLHQELKTSDFMAKPWLEALLRRNGNLFEDNEIIVSPESLDIQLHADPDLLEIALLNLIENACKYSPPRSPVVIATIAENGCTGFSVADSGLGISESQQAEIFNDYVRLENAVQPGLGLGLAFVKRIMVAHHGTVSLASMPGVGSTFKLLFPSLQASH